MLLRLFQTSRRFNVEIQPQLVLLQKTLLNIEGLGRAARPRARPVGDGAAVPRTVDAATSSAGAAFATGSQQEATQFATFVPQMPRLLHRVLAQEAETPLAAAVADLTAATRRTRHAIAVGFGVVGVLLAVLIAIVGSLLAHDGWCW